MVVPLLENRNTPHHTNMFYVQVTFICVLLVPCVLGDPTIVSRSEWGARSPRSRSYRRLPVSEVIIHHSDTPSCYTSSSCKARVRSIQNHHMNTNRWSDIGYNFLVGEDGRVYEGRGWNKVGAHARGYNSRSVGICMIGDFMSSIPNGAALNAVRGLLAMGLSQGKLTSYYRLRGHSDVGATSCPGSTLYYILSSLKLLSA
ncbi:peptidoglycan-recognition protein SC2-like [Gigantopelta aegis]|uniref:peptidoglycan-recognition protein SC2-like n=1 Tax=Gigantopelta aegis TaxID=1735272 RepID=UPI001B888A0C|nr:peptidoglycan-recognition protein SC2-like [Gigantopelta aegis]